jgi:hypothetical protein
MQLAAGQIQDAAWGSDAPPPPREAATKPAAAAAAGAPKKKSWMQELESMIVDLRGGSESASDDGPGAIDRFGEPADSKAKRLADMTNVRKKDSPTELAGILEQIAVQEKQQRAVSERYRDEEGPDVKPQTPYITAERVATPLHFVVPCGEKLYSQNWYGDIEGCR